MKNRQRIIFFIVLISIAGTAWGLTWLCNHQKLGKPGLKATPIPGQISMQIELPENVEGFTSTNVPESEVELGYFPKDTSYARRCYQSSDGAPSIFNTVIMMGADRTSIHKPDYCLPGQGWKIGEKTIAKIPIADANYELPIAKWIVSNSFQGPDGSRQTVSAIYVFWFVADNEQTTDNYQRMWWLARDLLHTGILQRWAYVSYFAICEPGQENATFDRIKKLIGNSVGKYQFPPSDKVDVDSVKN